MWFRPRYPGIHGLSMIMAIGTLSNFSSRAAFLKICHCSGFMSGNFLMLMRSTSSHKRDSESEDCPFPYRPCLRRRQLNVAAVMQQDNPARTGWMLSCRRQRESQPTLEISLNLLARNPADRRPSLPQFKIFDCGNGFFRCLVQNRPPAAFRAGRHIFRPVIQVDDLRALPSGECFERFVDFSLRLHRADLVRIDVTVEIPEEREISIDVFDGQVIGV